MLIDSTQLAKELNQATDPVVLVDVREPEEFEEGHLPHAKLIPLGEITTRAPKELSKEDNIVVYCAHGIRSLEGAMALNMLGFSRCRSLQGGIVAWVENQQASRL